MNAVSMHPNLSLRIMLEFLTVVLPRNTSRLRGIGGQDS